MNYSRHSCLLQLSYRAVLYPRQYPLRQLRLAMSRLWRATWLLWLQKQATETGYTLVHMDIGDSRLKGTLAGASASLLSRQWDVPVLYDVRDGWRKLAFRPRQWDVPVLYDVRREWLPSVRRGQSGKVAWRPCGMVRCAKSASVYSKTMRELCPKEEALRRFARSGAAKRVAARVVYPTCF